MKNRRSIVEILALSMSILLFTWFFYKIKVWWFEGLYYLLVLCMVIYFQYNSHVPLKTQGIRFDNFMISIKPVMIATALFTILITGISYLLNGGQWRLDMFSRTPWFLIWGTIQQFLLQSFLLIRVRSIVQNKYLTVIISTLIFCAMHIPNPLLVIFTFVGGLVWCGIFIGYPNIFALGLSHAIIDLWLLAVFPAELLANLRVGGLYLAY